MRPHRSSPPVHRQVALPSPLWVVPGRGGCSRVRFPVRRARRGAVHDARCTFPD
ncbi:hypothetical protein Ae168Ps1_0925c [Pseudonocardia sp. Ae168_Ps1]|nr:hypothetical protein Ae150APs1_0925c [Pseudonocardia sp. Ae150A_Ps1]OLL78519.1 hypothetical protein Ae168Ps1_0925c [Pseudonocardia sp. Ae168_Ps1]OLL87356.1 hypothetical protein Ae263Ps1_4411 [Pseudonocardia sp. Ae263_Ps1]OLL92615.1 hypothetical protein Ae356Ps1_2512c [Pseudonocardia sp. Ae356_Ps1]